MQVIVDIAALQYASSACEVDAGTCVNLPLRTIEKVGRWRIRVGGALVDSLPFHQFRHCKLKTLSGLLDVE